MPTAWKTGVKSLYLRRNYTGAKSVISSLVQGGGSQQFASLSFYFSSFFVLSISLLIIL